MILDSIRDNADSIIIRESESFQIILTPQRMKVIITKFHNDKPVLSFRIVFNEFPKFIPTTITSYRRSFLSGTYHGLVAYSHHMAIMNYGEIARGIYHTINDKYYKF